MAEDTFAYGYDIGISIFDLIEKMLQINSNVEFYFGSLHCRWILEYKDKLIALCKQNKVKKLHIGLQHVNEEILSRMGRDTDFKKVYEIIKLIKKVNPTIYLSADIIVGFPGETSEQFNELLEFFKRDNCFDRIMHFGYSDVNGAQSNCFTNKIPQNIIAIRWNTLNKTLGQRSSYNLTFKPDDRLSNEPDYYICHDVEKE